MKISYHERDRKFPLDLLVFYPFFTLIKRKKNFKEEKILENLVS